MKKIELTQGKFALVDDEDFEWLSKFRWHFDGYYAARNVSRKIGKRIIRMHRQILGSPGTEIDHVNGDKLDNQKKNLRLCDRSQNTSNRKAVKGSSKYKGVYFNTTFSKWYANIGFRGESVFAGSFESEIEAAETYDFFAIMLHEDFAVLNF